MKKINYSIRCTDKQKEIIQKFAKELDTTVINSILTAIEQYDTKETIETIEEKLKKLNKRLDSLAEQYKALDLFPDDK